MTNEKPVFPINTYIMYRPQTTLGFLKNYTTQLKRKFKDLEVILFNSVHVIKTSSKEAAIYLQKKGYTNLNDAEKKNEENKNNGKETQIEEIEKAHPVRLIEKGLTPENPLDTLPLPIGVWYVKSELFKFLDGNRYVILDDEFIKDITKNGIQDEPIVSPDAYIADGQRRISVGLKLGFPAIKVIIKELSEVEVLLYAFRVDHFGKKWNPVNRGYFFKSLEGRDWDLGRIAKEFNISTRSIQLCKRLTTDNEIALAIQQKKITEKQVRPLFQIEAVDERHQALESAIKYKLTNKEIKMFLVNPILVREQFIKTNCQNPIEITLLQEEFTLLDYLFIDGRPRKDINNLEEQLQDALDAYREEIAAKKGAQDDNESDSEESDLEICEICTKPIEGQVYICEHEKMTIHENCDCTCPEEEEQELDLTQQFKDLLIDRISDSDQRAELITMFVALEHASDFQKTIIDFYSKKTQATFDEIRRELNNGLEGHPKPISIPKPEKKQDKDKAEIHARKKAEEIAQQQAKQLRSEKKAEKPKLEKSIQEKSPNKAVTTVPTIIEAEGTPAEIVDQVAKQLLPSLDYDHFFDSFVKAIPKKKKKFFDKINKDALIKQAIEQNWTEENFLAECDYNLYKEQLQIKKYTQNHRQEILDFIKKYDLQFLNLQQLIELLNSSEQTPTIHGVIKAEIGQCFNYSPIKEVAYIKKAGPTRKKYFYDYWNEKYKLDLDQFGDYDFQVGLKFYCYSSHYDETHIKIYDYPSNIFDIYLTTEIAEQLTTDIDYPNLFDKFSKTLSKNQKKKFIKFDREKFIKQAYKEKWTPEIFNEKIDFHLYLVDIIKILEPFHDELKEFPNNYDQFIDWLYRKRPKKEEVEKKFKNTLFLLLKNKVTTEEKSSKAEKVEDVVKSEITKDIQKEIDKVLQEIFSKNENAYNDLMEQMKKTGQNLTLEDVNQKLKLINAAMKQQSVGKVKKNTHGFTAKNYKEFVDEYIKNNEFESLTLERLRKDVNELCQNTVNSNYSKIKFMTYLIENYPLKVNIEQNNNALGSKQEEVKLASISPDTDGLGSPTEPQAMMPDKDIDTKKPEEEPVKYPTTKELRQYLKKVIKDIPKGFLEKKDRSMLEQSTKKAKITFTDINKAIIQKLWYIVNAKNAAQGEVLKKWLDFGQNITNAIMRLEYCYKNPTVKPILQKNGSLEFSTESITSTTATKEKEPSYPIYLNDKTFEIENYNLEFCKEWIETLLTEILTLSSEEQQIKINLVNTSEERVLMIQFESEILECKTEQQRTTIATILQHSIDGTDGYSFQTEE